MFCLHSASIFPAVKLQGKEVIQKEFPQTTLRDSGKGIVEAQMPTNKRFVGENIFKVQKTGQSIMIRRMTHHHMTFVFKDLYKAVPEQKQ